MNQDPIQERIIEYALERFVREGFTRVSVDAICNELGISKKTFYKHFANKEDLLSRIADRIMFQTAARIGAIVGSTTPFPQKLDELMTFVGQLYGRVGRLLRADIRLHAPSVWKRITDFRRERITANIGRLLEEGMRQGYVRPDVDPRVFIIAFVGAAEALLNPELLADEPFSGSDALHRVLRILFQGILSEETSRTLDELRHAHVSQR